jgi:hypothetical protein
MSETALRTPDPAARLAPARDGGPAALDAFLDPEVRRGIEETWSARINEQASLAAALADPSFLEAPSRHVALYADHGVVHARDVALMLLQVLDTADGRLIPARAPDRLGWMKAYGVLLACLHDIGMADCSAQGRAMHPEFATQVVLGPEFDGILRRLRDDAGGVAARIVRLGRAGALGGRAPEAVLREALALANCHSKSKVPTALLNDPGSLRRAMLAAAAAEVPARAGRPGPLHADFGWLDAPEGPGRELVEDVIDTLRALRCADALRQRGTALKTSGGYEVFVDERSANAVYALRPDPGHLYFLEVPDPVAAGEANLAGSQLDAGGDLRLSFHHGAFRDPATVRKAARSAALVVADIQADAIGSFERSDAAAHPGLRRHADIRILIESADDNPAFAREVRGELGRLDPVAAARARIVACLAPASEAERSRYLRSAGLDWDLARRRDVLRRIAGSGCPTRTIDPEAAFREVRRIALRAGERLIEAGDPSRFVYVPLGEGLRGLPLGGYPGFTIPAGVLVGATGVIRGAARNSSVAADRDLELLAIPKGAFLDHWHVTYDEPGFAALLAPQAG